MAKCEFCDKGVSFGIQVSHSHRRSNRMWKPNVKRVKVIVDGSPRHAYACTRCLRSGKVTRAVSESVFIGPPTSVGLFLHFIFKDVIPRLWRATVVTVSQSYPL